MKKIGLISDTHGYVHPKIKDFFADCDEIWHAGDIGNIQTANQLAAIKPLIAVHGNIDGQDIRQIYPTEQLFHCEEVKVFMTHIGGYPKRYQARAKSLIESAQPMLFISGHSHILKVMPDQRHKLLHINPGAAGNSGFHQKITFVRFQIDGKKISDLEIMEINRK